MVKLARQIASVIKINSSRKYLHAFVRQAAASLSPNGIVLDAGAGHSPYKQLFNNAQYESTDFLKVDKEYAAVSYVCDLVAIPVEANRYDMVVLTQVLEHVPEPQQVLKELYRVLKPGGTLWLSAPLFFAEHETPYDYYRYTQFGFSYLLQSVGFTIEKLEWLEGYYGTLAYQLETAAKALPVQPQAYGGGLVGMSASVGAGCLKPLFLLLSLCFSHLDVRQKYVSKGMCKNYAIVARKADN